MAVAARCPLAPQSFVLSVLAPLFVLTLPLAALGADAVPAPVSLPLSYYEERGLIPARMQPIPAPQAGAAVLATPAPGYHATSATVTLSQPGTYTVDLTAQTRVANRAIRLTNTGTVDVRNPWVVANSQRDWYDATRIMKEAVGTETVNDLKAFRLWQFLRTARYHWVPAEAGSEIHSPVKMLNVYGYGFCDDSANNLECLLRLAGFTDVRCWDITGHVVPEVSYDGGYRMLDPDVEVFYPKWDNKTVAGVTELAADPALVNRVSGDALAGFYSTTANNVSFQKIFVSAPTMAITLRPRESLERYFTNWHKFHDNYLKLEPPVFGNGRHTYAPDLGDTATATRFLAPANLAFGGTPALRIADGTLAGEGVLAMASPYVYVGGSVAGQLSLGDTSCTAEIQFSKDGVAFTTVGSFRGPYSGAFSVALDNAIATNSSAALYAFRVRVKLARADAASRAGLDSLSVCGEIQCAPAALPTLMYSRANRVSVSFTATGTPALEVVHEWEETDAEPAIVQPSAPVTPADRSYTPTLTPEFVWNSPMADDPDVWRRIKVTWDRGGYHPVSPLTAYGGEMPNYWSAPRDWLLPGNTYYWRVMEQDPLAGWGPAWQFKTSQSASVTDWGAY